MLGFFRILKYAFQNIGRNIGLSFMTVFILVLMLLSINVLWAVDVLTGEAINAVKEQVSASLYFVPDTEEESILEIQEYIDSFPEVLKIKIESREDVLADFKKRHANNMEVLDALKELGGNPFGATMVIKTREPKDYKKIITALDVPEYEYLIESKSFDGQEGSIIKLQDITNRIERVGFGLSFLFAIISFLIIFNTIRVSIQTQRQEIGIKRLVGASNWFIRGPYLIVALVYTVLSISLTIGIVFFSLHYLDPYLSVVFPNGYSLTNYFKSNILILFGIQSLSVLLLTIFSSLLAMRKQLKV